MPIKIVACCFLALVWMVACPNRLIAHKASDIRIKNMEYDEKGYRYVHAERVWKKGVPTVLVTLECKKAIAGITTAKLYYFNADKKQTGISSVVNSYFVNTQAGQETGFANPSQLPKGALIELHFAPPPNLVASDASRLLLVIGTDQFVAVKIEPNSTVEDFDFAEKALYQASQ